MRLLALMLSTAACNQVLGLDETEASGPDFDGDGVADRDDNCVSSTNPDQANRDGDAFGDACDHCPDLPTELDHDEDGDGTGDECDRCPIDPDFQSDKDGDSVGDPCDRADGVQNELVVFDPFLSLGSWTSDGASWLALGDSVAPASALPIGDPGLRNATITVPMNEATWMEAGYLSTETWHDGEPFGIALVDGNKTLAECTVVCTDGYCTLQGRIGTMSSSSVNVSPQPLAVLGLFYTPASGFICSLDQVTSVLGSNSVLPTTATVALFGEPTIRLRSFARWH